MAADNRFPSRQSGAMSNVVAVNAEGNALLSAARAAGPTCVNMLLWGAAKVGDRDAVRVLLAEGANREWCHPAGAEKPNPLCVAAKEGHQEVVKEMLSDDKRIRERMAMKALPFAAGSGHEDMVELLLKEVPRAVLRGSNEAPRAVAKAAEQGHQGIVERLLAAGLDVDMESDGYTPLQQACLNRRKDMDMVEYLLTAGADVNKATTPKRRTPLFLTSMIGHREVVELLLDAGAEVDKTDYRGHTPLFAASMEGHREVVKLLLASGAEVDKENSIGFTPLSIAAKNGNTKVCSVLLRAGADINHGTDKEGITAICTAVYNDEVAAALLLMRWEPSLAGLDDEEAESLVNWLADEIDDKEAMLQEKESEINNLDRGILEWCNAAAAVCRKKHKKGQQQEN